MDSFRRWQILLLMYQCQRKKIIIILPHKGWFRYARSSKRTEGREMERQENVSFCFWVKWRVSCKPLHANFGLFSLTFSLPQFRRRFVPLKSQRFIATLVLEKKMTMRECEFTDGHRNKQTHCATRRRREKFDSQRSVVDIIGITIVSRHT